MKVSVSKKETLLMSVSFIIMIMLMIAFTLSWLPRKVWKTKTIFYNNDLIISSLDLDVEFQAYDPSALSGEGDYVDIAIFRPEAERPVNPNPVTVKLNPGDRQSYRFIITNNSLYTQVSTNIVLEKFFADKIVGESYDDSNPESIFEYLSIYISTPDISEIPKLSDSLLESYTGDLNVDFYNNLVIDPGEEVTIVWYIELSTEAGNEFWGTYFGFGSIFFSV